LYDYRLAGLTDFTENNAFELRGLCFVYDELTLTWERHILMNKFFNVGQTDGWLYDDLKNKKIVKVQDKLDGSVISFVKFPDGTVRAKSKMSFTSDQAVMAQKLYEDNSSLRMFIHEELEKGYVAIFELCSPENQIVLEYDKTELVLLQIRDSRDGSYLNSSYLYSRTMKFMIPKAMKYDVSILQKIANKYTEEELVELIKDKEFEDISEFILFINS
jgi:RNA ligase